MSNDRPRTTEEWRELIRQTSRQEVILNEMIRTGFWPPDTPPAPDDPPEEAARRVELAREIARLRQEIGTIDDAQRLLKKLRKERWEASKRIRAERKAQREKERLERRKAWEERRQREILHLGEGVSGGLSHTTYNAEKLDAYGLPRLGKAEDVAAAMGISVGKLRWLTYHRDLVTLVHYHRFSIPKRKGGERLISAPKSSLKLAQAWVLENILSKLPAHDAAQGFIKGKSILHNAAPHVGKAVVVNLDLKDFFPSITFKRVKGLFRSFGYSEVVATVLALLCTEPPRQAVTHDGKMFHVAIADRQLPQGACTSPAITNLLCRHLDKRLSGLAAQLGFTYTRYADDMTFSSDEVTQTISLRDDASQTDSLRHEVDKRVGKLIKAVTGICAFEGLRVHPEKIRVLRKAQRQEVTGIVVNEKANLSRRDLRRLRAILHNCEKHGIESQSNGRPDFLAYLCGMVAYVRMVNPEQGAKFAEQLARIMGAAE
jgi:retron-type reverse transcriptase